MTPPSSSSTHPGEEKPVVEQVVELLETLLHRLPSGVRQVQLAAQRRHLLAREENSLGVCSVVQQREPRSADVTAQVHHLCHQICRQEGAGQQENTANYWLIF